MHGSAIDLTRAPWKASAAAWQHPLDYSACQALAAAARGHGVAWIRYASVRRPDGVCGAVLAPKSLSSNASVPAQTWVSKVTPPRRP